MIKEQTTPEIFLLHLTKRKHDNYSFLRVGMPVYFVIPKKVTWHIHAIFPNFPGDVTPINCEIHEWLDLRFLQSRLT